ncbi:MAG: acyl-ACP--UDP-N-acetylglucosamine O-acyltransferase [Holosporaceae bacterium]|jgi:UDP-N-acetylglucosamine acyltransferase|nr:acyl-ACP--UDP-N-acetylglucosamine O-acyltransferase [Holosporaceae bacterium]
MIHPSAVISPSAKIGKNVQIGPYSVIGDEVDLRDNVEILSHVCVDGRTVVGEGTKIFSFAAIGYPPQDLKYGGESSILIIGKNNSLREYVTIHPGTRGGIMKTVIGDNNLFMIGVHIAHDCVIGNNVIMGNNATLGGHVKIDDSVIIGGLSAVHQYVRIGRNAVIGGMSGVERDVIPYGAVKGERARLYGINLIGLKRSGVSRQEITKLRKAYDVIFSRVGTLNENLNALEQIVESSSYVNDIVKFMRGDANRSFCLPKEINSKHELL